MRLIEIIHDLDAFDVGGTICARGPWSVNSEATVIVAPQARQIPAAAEKLGLEYFLDVFIARDFLDDWMANLDAEPTLQQKCQRLINYAINDA